MANSECGQFAVLVLVKEAQEFRLKLEDNHFIDDQRKLRKVDDTFIAIPVKKSSLQAIKQQWPDIDVIEIDLAWSSRRTSKDKSPGQILRNQVTTFINVHGLPDYLIREVPAKWVKHEDLVILPSSCFSSSIWNPFKDELWKLVLQSLKCKRLALQFAITKDGFRSPQVQLLIGDDGWVTHIDNGIKYKFDVTKCMFSSGNISEKLRVACMNCQGQTIVDLYAGIGYFTLPYLVHGGAEHVHACEWNPAAVAALRENLLVNGVSDKCTVHVGDNRKMELSSVADRVNLGLIPSSESGWPIAVQALKTSGGILHIHGNMTSSASMNAEKMLGRDTNHMDFNGSRVGDATPFDLCTAQGAETDSFENEDLSQCCTKSSTIISNKRISLSCQQWAWSVRTKISRLLQEVKGGVWLVKELHLELVKSYAPHVVHVVLDLECTPEVSVSFNDD